MKYQISEIDLTQCDPPKQGTRFIVEKLEEQVDFDFNGLVVVETNIFKTLKDAENYANKSKKGNK